MLPNWLTQWRHMMGNRFVGSSNLDAVASSPFGGVQSDIDFTEKSVGGPQPPLLGKQETEPDGTSNRRTSKPCKPSVTHNPKLAFSILWPPIPATLWHVNIATYVGTSKLVKKDRLVLV